MVTTRKSKGKKYHEGMIGDININDRIYKAITIENIMTSPDLSEKERKELLQKAKSTPAIGEKVGQAATVSRLKSLLARVIYEPAPKRKVTLRAPTVKRPKAKTSSRNIYQKGRALSRRPMGRGSKVVMRTRRRTRRK